MEHGKCNKCGKSSFHIQNGLCAGCFNDNELAKLWSLHRQQKKQKTELPPAGDLGELKIRTGISENEGACNFCTKDHRRNDKIHVLNGHRLEVRICDHCLKKIQEYESPWWSYEL